MTLRGLTWDHPRGYVPLRAAQREQSEPGCRIEWDVQPLEGFESTPIEDIADHYDLIVIDHPHVGDAVAVSALRPLDDVFDRDTLRRWRAGTVGASFDSYWYAGRQWAAPIDAATQVSALADPTIPPPDSWEDAVAMASDVSSAVPVAGPHPFLTLCSIALSYGTTPGDDGRFLPEASIRHALELLSVFTGPPPDDGIGANPIRLLAAMAAGTGVGYCPHVYQYVNYANSPHPLVFHDAPAGPYARGSVLGGTGIAITRRCDPTPELRAHLAWLMAPETQLSCLPRNDGQPAATAAWSSAELNAAYADFFTATRATIDGAWVRPRGPLATRFQSRAADAVRQALWEHQDTDVLARQLDSLYDVYRSASMSQEENL